MGVGLFLGAVQTEQPRLAIVKRLHLIGEHNMKSHRIGIIIGLALALIAYPGENLFAAKKRAPAQPSQGNTRANPNDPGGHSAKGVEFAKKKEYDKAVEEFSQAIQAE